LGKVVELIDVLKTQLDTDTQQDGDNYAAYSEQTMLDIAEAKRVIRETKTNIESLETSLEEEENTRTQLKQDLETAAAELAQAEKELADAKKERDDEHKVFLKNEAVFEESIDQLTRSMEVLQKRFADQPAEGGASLLTVATTVRKTLEQGADFSLSAAQKETLEQFFRAAKVQQPKSGKVPSFLQIRSGEDPPAEEAAAAPAEPEAAEPDYGEYQTQSSPVVTTLQGVLDKTNTNKQAAMTAEQTAVNEFTTLETNLNTQIESAKTRMEDLKTQIAESQQRTGQYQADLLAAKDLLKTTEDHKELLEQDFQAKTRAYKERAVKRSDELTAVKEAVQVLTSESAKRFMSQQSVGIMEAAGPAPAPAGPPSFLQIDSDTRRKAIHLVHNAPNGVVLLALQTHTRLASRQRAPFDKVKEMIKEMIDKLMGSAAEDAEHHAFCETEMTKSHKSKSTKEENVQKLTDRLSFMSAEIERLTDEVAQAQHDLTDMAQSLQAANLVRSEEHQRAQTAMTEYADAQQLLKHALDVLNQFYSQEAREADTAGTLGSEEVHGERNREGLGAGIVSILEIAVEDFAELESSTKLEETKAQKMFKDLMLETRIRTAQFEKDVEYKTREKVKIEGDKARTEADLKSYQKELAAVSEYLEQLKGSCIAKAEPYEDRKARREAELQSLKEALDFLNGEGAAPSSSEEED
jgi:chromosome segregation ATPase